VKPGSVGTDGGNEAKTADSGGWALVMAGAAPCRKGPRLEAGGCRPQPGFLAQPGDLVVLSGKPGHGLAAEVGEFADCGV
jgi:hypothetical protein